MTSRHDEAPAFFVTFREAKCLHRNSASRNFCTSQLKEPGGIFKTGHHGCQAVGE